MDNIKLVQVIEELSNGVIRTYRIVDVHMATDSDPLTTIRIDGFYKDVELVIPKSGI